MKKWLDKFFHSNSWEYRLLRTIAQGMIAVLIQALATGFSIDAFLIPVIMAILSPIMAEMKTGESDQ